MSKAAPETSQVTLRYALDPDPAAAQAIEATFVAYDRMMRILDDVAPDGANLVLLHERAYEKIRVATQLPARLVTLGLRDRANYVVGATVRRLPLDEKLYAIKGPTSLTIATVQGRVAVPFHMPGYRAGWEGPFAANLVSTAGGYEIHIAVTPHSLQNPENKMTSENILARTGRLLAGIAQQAIDSAEDANKLAVVNQAIREINAAADEARAALGKSRSEEFRLKSRQREIESETLSLGEKIQTALAKEREDLARAGIARQIDLESQNVALERAMDLVKVEIEEQTKALQAILSARREAEARLHDLTKSLTLHAPEKGPSARGAARPKTAERALAAISRVTGVPAGAPGDSHDLDELDRLHREEEIVARLKQFKASQ